MAKKVPDSTDNHVRNRIRMRRLMLGMSQEKLAHAIGLRFQQVHKYETGASRIIASRLQQIAKVLQVPVTFFFEGAPGQRTISTSDASLVSVSEFLATPNGLALAKAFMQIKDAKVRRCIVNLVKEIAD